MSYPRNRRVRKYSCRRNRLTKKILIRRISARKNYMKKKSYKNKKPHGRLQKDINKNVHNLTKKEKSTNLSLQCACKFLSYEEIINFLNDLSQRFSSNLQLDVIGESREGRPIFLTILSASSSEYPKNATFIEAGSDGGDWVAITSALYMIEHLAKNASCSENLKIMNYFIIPCSNPDAYQMTQSGKQPYINLTTNFPFRLGKSNIEDIPMSQFLKTAKVWKENYEFNCPEKLAVLKVLTGYQFAIKLFISLQEEGQKIVYPYGVSADELPDIEDIRKIALAGKPANCICYPVGSIYQLCGLTFGTIVDFLIMFQNSIQFPYIFHINNKKCPFDPKNVPEKAKELLNCIKKMSEQVVEFYKEDSGKDDDSKENLTNTTKRVKC